MDADTRISAQTSRKAQHLCVLVHGLWGNPSHLWYVHQALREEYSEDQLIILDAKRNAASLTYDGVEIGAERVTREIELYLEELDREGYKIKKLSVVGYSLGGLVARYVIALLYYKGLFERIEPVNFTTFASPHLGVRTPLVGYQNRIWNILGARCLSMSGRQLFTIDNFRHTGRPILSVMTDPDSIFIHALKGFKHRVLYTNIVNDRSATYYTTGITRYDPYAAIDKLKLNYLPGYKDVILDPSNPMEVKPHQDLPSFYQRLTINSRNLLYRIPIWLGLAIILPIAIVAFFVNSGIQTFRSRYRRQAHESDKEAWGVYRIPNLVQDVRLGLEDAFENVNSAQDQDYLPAGTEELAEEEDPQNVVDPAEQETLLSEKSETDPLLSPIRRVSTSSEFRPLALTTAQFAMIKSLNDVGWTKYPVHIHKSSHSHAAMIYRSKRSAFDEGKIVVKHWTSQAFEI